MADISRLSRLLNGVQRGVDISANTLVTSSIKVGGGSPTELTKTILDRLISLQNGSDVDATYHTHDGRYFTETELGSSTSSSGSDLIGDDNTYSEITPAAATVKGALSGIDTALGTKANQDLGNLTSPTAVNQDLLPDSDNTRALGSATSRWATASIEYLIDNSENASIKPSDRQLLDETGSTPKVDWSGTDVSLNSHKLTNVVDPTAAQDAATKAYVDAVAQGLKPKQAVRVGSTADIDLATELEDGDVIDGITLATGDRVLVKDQTAPEENGIYIVQATGAAVRATDFDSLSPVDEINGAYTFIQEGTQAGQGWVQQGAVTDIDVDPIVFVYFNSVAGITGGDMITVTGTSIAVDLATISGLESSNPGNSAGQLRVKLEASNPSLKITGSNELAAKLDAAGAITSGASGLAVGVDSTTIEISANALRVKDAGITLAKLASDSVDENKIVSTTMSATGAITGGSGSKLAVAVDSSTIEISSNALRVKDAGITLAKLASDSVDENKIVSTTMSASGAITGGSGTKLAVAVDGSTLEIATNAVRVKDAGIATAKIAADAVDDTKIRLRNAQPLRARNAANDGDVSILSVDASDIIQFASFPRKSGTPTNADELVNKSYVDGLSSGSVSRTVTVGESMAATTTFAVRWAKSGETAGRVYKADLDTTSADNFSVIGFVVTSGALTAGNTVSMIMLGSSTLAASDTPFSAGDIGKPVFLQASGAFSVTEPTTALQAVVIVGYVESTTKLDVKPAICSGVV